MSRFLLVFDRRRGVLRSLREFDNARDAVQARLREERLNAADPDAEVVVLGAKSEASLRETHARYFGDFQDIASDALANWPETA